LIHNRYIIGLFIHVSHTFAGADLLKAVLQKLILTMDYVRRRAGVAGRGQ